MIKISECARMSREHVGKREFRGWGNIGLESRRGKRGGRNTRSYEG